MCFENSLEEISRKKFSFLLHFSHTIFFSLTHSITKAKKRQVRTIFFLFEMYELKLKRNKNSHSFLVCKAFRERVKSFMFYSNGAHFSKLLWAMIVSGFFIFIFAEKYHETIQITREKINNVIFNNTETFLGNKDGVIVEVVDGIELACCYGKSLSCSQKRFLNVTSTKALVGKRLPFSLLLIYQKFYSSFL